MYFFGSGLYKFMFQFSESKPSFGCHGIRTSACFARVKPLACSFSFSFEARALIVIYSSKTKSFVQQQLAFLFYLVKQ